MSNNADASLLRTVRRAVPSLSWPAIERAKLVMPNVKLLLLDNPSALFLAVKTGRATAFSIDKPIADFYEHENEDLTRLDVNGTIYAYVKTRQILVLMFVKEDLTRLDVNGTIYAYVANDSIFMKPGDFKWWLFLDTWVGELRSGFRYEKYVEWYRKWLRRDPPPQRFYDYNKY